MSSPPCRSVLRHTAHEELHDLVCIGFGPASLAIAVALHDMLSTPLTVLAPRTCHAPKVVFLEGQTRFAWHAGMLVPGATMQISFIKDLATLRNPKSDFTFLNYLHRRQRLIHFSNLGTFLPLRLEYEDYLRWCAGWFEEVVEYDQEVLDVTPERLSADDSKISSFVVRAKEGTSGQVTSFRTKHVVIAVGGRPKVPRALPLNHPRIFHSSRYTRVISTLLKEIDLQHHAVSNGDCHVAPARPVHIAVIGNGQSAAEIFNDLHSRCPHAKTSMFIKGGALRPSDDSPFVNEIFNPQHVDELYAQSPQVREAAIAEDRGTNYGVVRLELLEKIYGTIYEQRIRTQDEETWQHRILPYRYVTAVEDLPSNGLIRLHFRNGSSACEESSSFTKETVDVDAVFAATGYVRNAHEEMLRPAEYLKPVTECLNNWHVARDYRVRFEPGTVSDDAGVWLQGCNESTHGLSDVLLSILATRAGEVVNSIFGTTLEKAGHANGITEQKH
ncbi:hypothetical protein MMC07_000854 [Pseudocyphellaria aurata]|nr:hypothetical protein [Pseudocyphellaria aurata]